MAQNDQDFECRQCGAHFDSREQLDRHTRQQHSAQAGSSSSSNYGQNPDESSAFDADENDLNS